MQVVTLDRTMTLTPEEARSLPYVDLISILQETNRCPGGLDTIRRIAKETFLSPSSRVLEIGSNTGFTSLELARLTGCTVVGVDVNPQAVAVSQDLLSRDAPQIRDRVEFKVASAYDLPFDDDSFDVVVAGGAFSFMDAKPRALEEVVRVLRPWGHFSATNLCYLAAPDEAVLAAVGEIIGVEIHGHGPGDWVEVYGDHPGLQNCLADVTHLGMQSEQRLDDYVAYFAAKPHLLAYSAEVRSALIEKWRDVIGVFNRNHEHLGYITLIYRKAALAQEPELFTRAHRASFPKRVQLPTP
jgi:SAM-dependent methyltransferase